LLCLCSKYCQHFSVCCVIRALLDLQLTGSFKVCSENFMFSSFLYNQGFFSVLSHDNTGKLSTFFCKFFHQNIFHISNTVSHICAQKCVAAFCESYPSITESKIAAQSTIISLQMLPALPQTLLNTICSCFMKVSNLL
jgi:hypothetical protein